MLLERSRMALTAAPTQPVGMWLLDGFIPTHHGPIPVRVTRAKAAT
jgi:hypothetical protein